MRKIKSLLKMAFAAVLLFSYAGITQAQDELVGTYKWNVQYNVGGMDYAATDPTADITVEVRKSDNSNYYIQQVSGTDVFQGLTIPFTLNGEAVTYPLKALGNVGGKNNVFVQYCTPNYGFYYPQQANQTGTFKPEVGFTFYGNPAPKQPGFGWFSSTSPSSYNPDMGCVAAFIINSQEVVPAGGEYEVIGTYDLKITECAITGATIGEQKTISVEVGTDGTGESELNYIMKQVDGDDFNGTVIPFTYNPVTKQATIKGFYAGEFENPLESDTQVPVWCSMFWYLQGASAIEMGDGTPIYFNPETGFSADQNNLGLAWVITTNAEAYDPVDIYNAYYLDLSTDQSGEEDPGDGTYPALSTLAGNHIMTATVNYNLNGVETYLPQEATFNINSNKLTDFIGPNPGNDGVITLRYDEATGTINLASNSLGGMMVGGFSGTYYDTYYVPEGQEFEGEVMNGTTNINWQVTKSGNIVIPNFSVVSGNGSVIATYTDVIVDGYVPGTEDKEEITGLYDWTIQPVTYTGRRSPAVTIQVEVVRDTANEGDENTTNYFVKELGNSNYFNGTEIPFVYREGAKLAEFTAFYDKEIGGKPVWCTPIVYGTSHIEANENLGISLSKEKGWEFAERTGFGWFVTEGSPDSEDGDGQSDFNPTGEIISAFYVGVTPGDEGDGEIGDGKVYPALSTLEGEHVLTADVTIEPGYELLASFFPEEKTFTMNATGQISSFIGQSGKTYNTAYEVADGTLTWDVNNLGSYLNMSNYVNYSFGYADAEGTWTGVAADGGIKPVWQVTEDGHILVPDFTIVNYEYGKQGGTIMVRYSNVRIDGYEPPAEAPYFALSEPVATPNYENGTVVVTFNVESYNMPEDEISYKVVFTPNGDQEEEIRRAAANSIEVDATVEDGVGTAVLTGLLKGSYSYNIVLNAYNAEGELIASSSSDSQDDAVSVDFTLDQGLITGVEGINAENGKVRYFNLQGVEITNPEKGAVIIKVEGGKASKVIVK